jgi:hypothetical protein
VVESTLAHRVGRRDGWGGRTIVTDITFPEGGDPFGTFTALDPLCPSGTFVDEFVVATGISSSVRSRRR